MTDSEPVLVVTTPNGDTHRLPALAGWRIMEIIRDYGVPIKAECGGACACGTCHVYVAPEWAHHLPPPQPEEEERLADVWDRRPTSRLSCQIIMQDGLSGLAVTLAGDSAP